MNRRISHLYNTLVEFGRAAPLEVLADKWNVTLRTMRNDFHELNRYLLSVGNNQIQIEMDSSLSLLHKEGDTERFRDAISFYEYSLHPEERLLVLLIMLLLHNDYLPVNRIAQALSFSRSTLVGDCAVIKRKLAERGIILQASHARGIRLDGSDELSIRVLIADIARTDAFLLQLAVKEMIRNPIDDRFNELNYADIEDIVRTAEKSSGFFLSASSRSTVATYLLLVLVRSNLGHEVVAFNQEERQPSELAAKILEGLSRRYHVFFTVIEASILSNLLTEMQYIRLGNTPSSWKAVELQFVSRYFLSKLSSDISYDLNTDYKLFLGIAVYVKHITAGYKDQETDESESAGQERITSPYPELDEALERNFSIFNTRCGITLSLKERLEMKTMVYAAVLRIENAARELSYLIVCDRGEGISTYLMEQIIYKLNIREIQMIISPMLQDYLQDNQPDLIITTEALPALGIPMIVITSALSDKDIDLINIGTRRIKDKRYHDRIQAAKTDQLAIARNVLLQQQPYSGRKYSSDAESFQSFLESVYSIPSILHKDRISLDVEAETWREAVRKAAEILLIMNEITENELDDAIAYIEKRPEFVFVEDNLVMIPVIRHAQVQRKNAGMSFVRLRDSVLMPLAHEQKQVRNIGVIAIDRDNQHLKAVYYLSNRMREWAFYTAH